MAYQKQLVLEELMSVEPVKARNLNQELHQLRAEAVVGRVSKRYSKVRL